TQHQRSAASSHSTKS
ncbi:AICARFT/IMPCHase bienzyme family protein, partial [Vibrio parahaemolyticus V-223/04]